MTFFHTTPPLNPGPPEDCCVYRAPHLVHPLVLPWRYDHLWLAMPQIGKLYQLDNHHFRRASEATCLTRNWELASFCRYLTVSKWRKEFHEKFYRCDLVVALGHTIRSPYVADFEAWADDCHGCNHRD